VAQLEWPVETLQLLRDLLVREATECSRLVADARALKRPEVATAYEQRRDACRQLEAALAAPGASYVHWSVPQREDPDA
jgi:hypothetical protein